MPSYEHQKLVERIAQMDAVPSGKDEYAQWITGDQHLQLLRDNARESEIAVYASGHYTFLHAFVVPNRYLTKSNREDLLRWSCNPFHACASYVVSGGRDRVRVDRSHFGLGSTVLSRGLQLVFVGFPQNSGHFR